jgi:outer membrane lipoprotein LolB
MRSGRIWLAALLALALAACATPSAPPERVYSGRFSATATDGGRQNNSVSGRFTVEVRGNRQLIELATPVGTTVARIEIEPGRAQATGPQMQTVTGPNADELVERLLGWRLPVTGMADWLEGRPEPSRAARTRMSGERISEIEQDGWTIRIDEYSAATNKPRRLSLERPMTGREPAVSVRLIVDDPAA